MFYLSAIGIEPYLVQSNYPASTPLDDRRGDGDNVGLRQLGQRLKVITMAVEMREAERREGSGSLRV